MRITIAMPKLDNKPFRIYMKSKYVVSLMKNGARVKWIDMKNREKMKKQLASCDGLLLPGGGDIQPHLYGQEVDEKCGKPDVARDEGEWAILDAFLPTGKPILAICRGIQLMNVYLGGTLHQDIVEISISKHSDFNNRAGFTHKINLTPGTRLHAILGVDACNVNSMHHQATAKIAPGLVVSAVSADGIVEGLEKKDHPFFIGVQWHPEHMYRKNMGQRKIFAAFVDACKQEKPGKDIVNPEDLC